MDTSTVPTEFERYLRPLFDTMFEGIQILDPEWRYLYLNVTAAQHGRRERDELIGRRMTEVYPGIEQTAVFALMRRCMEERVPQSMVNEFTYPDGDSAWFDLRMDPVPMGILMLSIDVTAAKVAEARLREVQKLEAVGRLAGGVAHDFNNLLTVITGYSELLLRRMPADDRFRTDVQEIHEAGERATALTRQLLAFSRRQRLQSEVLDLNTVVARMDRMLRRLIGEDVDLVTTMHPALRPVLADPSQMEQVIMNLAVNARDAMPGGGKLTIVTDNVELDDGYAKLHADARPGRHVMLAISDTGGGMDQATQARIFEPFFTTKEQGKGTGLGLAMVYGIVKQSGGNIWVYSEPGHGATFKIYLPEATGAAAAATTASPPPRAAAGGETILVVEDDPAVRGFLRTILEEAGYRVRDTGDSDEALALAQPEGGPVDLLLTDVVLPTLDGAELATRILALRPGLPVMYMSGYTEDAIIHRGLLGPNTVFIDKPIAADSLLTKLRASLGPPSEQL